MTSADDLFASLSPALSRWGRLRGAFAGISGAAGAVLLITLQATEPHLPGSTRLMFALLTLVCLGWTAYGGWAVFRRPLFALDAVVAGWLAVGASVAVTVALVAVTESLAAALTGAGCLLAAVILLKEAVGRRRALLQRKAELES
jgi:hypothetical protein